MSFDQINTAPKLLVSDALKDILPEEQLNQVDEMFILVALVTEPPDHSLTGNLVGIEFGNNPKIDIKTSLKDAFNFIAKIMTMDDSIKKARSFALLFGKETAVVPGPFLISNLKIVEIDSSNKLCVLAIDLIKDAP